MRPPRRAAIVGDLLVIGVGSRLSYNYVIYLAAANCPSGAPCALLLPLRDQPGPWLGVLVAIVGVMVLAPISSCPRAIGQKPVLSIEPGYATNPRRFWTSPIDLGESAPSQANGTGPGTEHGMYSNSTTRGELARSWDAALGLAARTASRYD